MWTRTISAHIASSDERHFGQVNEVLGSAATLLGGIGGTVLLVAPGYVMGRVYNRGVRGPELGDQAFLAAAALGGVLTHALLLWWTVPLWSEVLRAVSVGASLSSAVYLQIAVWTGVVLLVAPASIGAICAHVVDIEPRFRIWRLLDIYNLTTTRRTAESWIWIFSRLHRSQVRRWLKVRLKDGRSYLGVFAGDSFASSDARVRDLYLQEWWDLNEIGQAVPPEQRTRNAGVWIHGEEIVSVEFYEFDDGEEQNAGKG